MNASPAVRINALYAALMALIMAFILSGCEDNKPSQIEWQLPLEAPEDPHGSHQVLVVPDWAAASLGDAEFVWLQKSTARLFPVHLASGAQISIEEWDIHLLGLASGLRIQNKAFLNDENVDNPAAFVSISRDGKPVYTGWLYAKFPELFGLDDPEWKVWLKGITLRPALEDGDNKGSLSSAG